MIPSLFLQTFVEYLFLFTVDIISVVCFPPARCIGPDAQEPALIYRDIQNLVTVGNFYPVCPTSLITKGISCWISLPDWLTQNPRCAVGSVVEPAFGERRAFRVARTDTAAHKLPIAVDGADGI